MSSRQAKNIVAIYSMVLGCASMFAAFIAGEDDVAVFIWAILFLCFGVILFIHLKPALMRAIIIFIIMIYCFGVLVGSIMLFIDDALTGAVGIVIFGIPFSFGIVYLVRIRKENQILQRGGEIKKGIIERNKENRKYEETRNNNHDMYMALFETLEDRFKNNIVLKEPINETLAEYKYFFQSEYIEFNLYFKKQIIGDFENTKRHGFFRFDSLYDIEKGDFQKLLDKIEYLINGNIFFGDIYTNGKFVSCFWSDMSVYRNVEPADINLILDDAFDDVLEEGAYTVKAYGSREFGDLEVTYQKSRNGSV